MEEQKNVGNTCDQEKEILQTQCTPAWKTPVLVSDKSPKTKISFQVAVLVEDVPTTPSHSPVLSLPLMPAPSSCFCGHSISWFEEPIWAKRASLLPKAFLYLDHRYQTTWTHGS